MTLDILSSNRATRIACCAVTSCLLSLPINASSQVTFSEISDSAGVGEEVYGSTTEHGGGVNWIDFDKDGYDDLFLINGFDLSPHLFRNEGNGTFSNADNLLPTLPNVEMMGSVFGDYDNDGDSDIYIFTESPINVFVETARGAPPNMLLKNQWVENGSQTLPGQPLFQEVAAAAGVQDLLPQPGADGPSYRSTTGAFLDYDRDGYLDLYVCHWLFEEGGLPDNIDRLYRNNGDGTFADVTASAGINSGTDSSTYKPCLAMFAGHLDNDLWPDLWIGNVSDSSNTWQIDSVYRNQGNGTFTDATSLSPGVGDDSHAAMGFAVADIDLDGDWDVYISDLFNADDAGPTVGNPLYLGSGNGIQFQDDSAAAAGISATHSWGVNFFDANQDGYEDLYVGTCCGGHTSTSNLFYLNDGDGTFTDISSSAGFSGFVNTHGTAVSDMDRDGDLDLVSVNIDLNNLELFRNDSANTGNWVQFDLTGVQSNRDAIGAVATVSAGGASYKRQITGLSSGHGQDSLRMHFGVGTATVIDQATIEWPSGIVQVLTGLPVNTIVDVTETEASNPQIISPVPGSILTAGTQTFTWDGNSAPVTAWQLQVGSTFGGSNIFDSGTLGAGVLSANVTGLPTNGSLVYVRLMYTIASGTEAIDYTYIASNPTGTPQISNPPPGSVLTATSQTFTLSDNGAGVTNWQLNLGSTPGASNLGDSGILASSVTSTTVSGLPTNGSTIYATLYWVTGPLATSPVQQAAFTYTAMSTVPGATPVISDPVAGSVLPGSSDTFTLNANGVAITNWQLQLGTTPGASNLADSGLLAGSVTSTILSGLPTNGSTIYATLNWVTGSSPVQQSAFTYIAASSGPDPDPDPEPGEPSISDPVAGSVLPGSADTFTVAPNGSGMTFWSLRLGTAPGRRNIADSGTLAASQSSVTFAGLPVNGSTIHATLSWVDGPLASSPQQQIRFTYTAFAPDPNAEPEISRPSPGSVLAGDTVTFQFDDNGAGVTNWQLTLGSAQGGSNLLDTGILSAATTSTTPTGLPTNGSTIYATLRWVTGSSPVRQKQFTYTSGPETQDVRDPSVARQWNEVLLDGIRGDFARPTVHARNLWHISAAMYDAWAAYDDVASTYLLGKTVGGYQCTWTNTLLGTDPQTSREEAVSYAAYRMLRHRFAGSPGQTTTFAEADNLMTALGFDVNVTSTNTADGSPASLGNRIAECYIAFGLQDGSNEVNKYANQYYQPINPPIEPYKPGNPNIIDLDRWQTVSLPIAIDQSGNPVLSVPPALSPEWGQVTPFALSASDLTIYQRGGFDYYVYHDPGTPPTIHGTYQNEYKWGFEMVATWSSHLDPSDGVMMDISPASLGNISYYPGTNWTEYPQFYDQLLGGDPGTGYPLNPITGQPYQPQIVPRGDYARVLAEFWADGPNSETPPGHWFTIVNGVSDNPLLVRRIGGVGPVLGPLEWDIKLYFTLGGAMHDVAITAWGIKGWYDYIRPVSAIRAMGDRGQSSDPNLPSYSPDGLTLIPGYIELVDAGDPLAGNAGENVGKIKVYAWRGPEFINDPDTDVAGVDWILAENWWSYQRPTFVTPPFPGYVSGHSTYSRAAAELMTAFTGSPYFPGGLGEFPAPAHEFLVFEDGPSVDVVLQWATYRDASDQTSLSRIWGGIHPPQDDLPGRDIGIEVGLDAYGLAISYFEGN